MTENNKSEKRIDMKSQYAKTGLTLFIVGVALILAYYVVNNMSVVSAGIEKINDILFPFYLGIVLAYLMCPVYNLITKLIYRAGKRRFRNPHNALKLGRFTASVVSLVVLIAAVSGIISMIIPDLWASITGLVAGIPDAFDKIYGWIMKHIEENPQLWTSLQGEIADLEKTAIAWAQNKFLPGAETIISNLSVGVMGTLGAVLDIFVALIICVYVLNSKEIFIAQSKKITLALFKPERAEKVFELGRITNETFGGFINGKIIDSIIIGILCFIAMTVLDLPLTMLVSVVVGVTNVIPFFGPFIGAIPCIIILLLIDPVAALKFAIMVLVLQQLDGNVIGPKILGKSTNLASFWVMFAIIVAGGLFGFVGMVLGVPVFAVMYTYIKRGINNRLRKKNLETETLMYEDFSKYNVDNVDKEVIFGKKHENETAEDDGKSAPQ